MSNDPTQIAHPRLSRRQIIQGGAIGLLGLSLADVNRSQALGAVTESGTQPRRRVTKVVYIFLPGGPPQHETFDPKPEAPASVRGEFQAIETRTPGMLICEHLPLLAQNSNKFALLRSMHHHSNGHIAGTTIMVSGDTRIPSITPAGKQPDATDTPGIAALGGYFRPGSNGVPGAAILPEYVGRGTGTGQVVSGQMGGRLGPAYDPWLVKTASDCLGWGACPLCFDDGDDDAVFVLGLQHEHSVPGPVFEDASLNLTDGLTERRFGRRLSLLETFERRRREVKTSVQNASHDIFRRQAISLLTSPKVRRALDLKHEDAKTLDEYGRNKFGWSMLLTRRLLEVGVNLIQVSLGRNGSWDLHRRAFPLLKDFLLPPTDRAVSSFLNDLDARGLLDETLVVLAGEFGRTPRLASPPGRRPGRDHWGPLQSILFAGGGVTGGNIVGASDKIGGYPHETPKTPEDLAATVFDALGIPPGSTYHDLAGRQRPVYLGSPISELFS